jgi:serine/threonine protein kinase
VTPTARQGGPTLPESIGPYRVESLLGIGGFATVYRARDERLDALVAVKVLAENHAHDPDLRERFVLEGRLLRRVSSPHILDVHEVGQTERAQPFLVLELAEGGDLASRVTAARREGGRPTAADVLTVVDAVADALGAMHRGGVVHRDLAPANLLLVGNGSGTSELDPTQRVLRADERVCVADLGLSKDLARASGLTVSGGTAGFTPPEQREKGSWVDVRADIWSASALVVWLLTGEPPGDDGGWRGRLEAVDLPAPVRAGLTAALSRGLSPRPDDRPATSEEWHREVTDAFTASDTDETDETDEPDEPTAAPARPARRRWTSVAAMLAAAVVVVALAALAGWLAGRGSDGDGSPRTTTENGIVRVETSQRDARLVLTGPEEMVVGEPATLEVESEGVADWVWVTPDGNTYPNTRAVEVVLTSPGTTRAVLVARDDDGRMLDASLTLTATDG